MQKADGRQRQLVTPVARRLCSYKGFPLLSNRIPSWLNRVAIDREICFPHL
jgi:hypothetical protein